MTPRRWLTIALIAVTGMGLGLSFYTFRYAKGFSYLSSDPKVCANCHIMQPQYDSWIKSSHHRVARCVECHLPHDFLGKYLAKIENGYFHSRAFTLQNFHEPIEITKKNARILEQNCINCHQDMVSDIAHRGSIHNRTAISCTHCHAAVGHGEKAAMGKIDSLNH